MKLVVPANLDLEDKINSLSDKMLRIVNNGNQLSHKITSTNSLKKYIPYLYLYLHSLIESINDNKVNNECQYPAHKGMYRIPNYKLEGFKTMSSRKISQVVNILEHLGIIITVRCRMTVIIDNQIYRPNTRYIKFLDDYNIANTKIVEYDLEYRVIEDKITKDALANLLHVQQEMDQLANINFDSDNAQIKVNELKSKEVINDKQYASYCNSIDKLKSGNYRIKYSDRCNRIFTSVNQLPKVLREYVVDNNNESLKELDFKAFVPTIIYKIILSHVAKHNVRNDKLSKEIYKYKECLSNDFYLSIGKILNIHNRNEVKELVLRYWINKNHNNNWNSKKYSLLKEIFPQITNILEKYKGNSKETVKKFYNSIMKKESELINKIIIYQFSQLYPEATIYNLFDGLMINESFYVQMKVFMEIIANKYFEFPIEITVKNEKVEVYD
jgi:hypothetical protein